MRRAWPFFWRVLAVAIVGSVSFAIFFPWSSREITKDSFSTSQEVQRDLELVGRFTEDFRLQNLRLPEADELDAFVDVNQSKLERLSAVWTAEERGGCYGKQYPTSQDVQYIICGWRGRWEESLNPRTKNTSLPQDISEFNSPITLQLVWATFLLVSFAFFGRKRWRKTGNLGQSR